MIERFPLVSLTIAHVGGIPLGLNPLKDVEAPKSGFTGFTG